MSYPDIFCPRCNIDKDVVSHSRGQLYNPCDSGCCSTLACKCCGHVFTLRDHGRAWQDGEESLVDWRKLHSTPYWWWTWLWQHWEPLRHWLIRYRGKQKHDCPKEPS